MYSRVIKYPYACPFMFPSPAGCSGICSQLEKQTVPTTEGNISTVRVRSDEMLKLKMQHASELASPTARLTHCYKIYSGLPLTWEKFPDAKRTFVYYLDPSLN